MSLELILESTRKVHKENSELREFVAWPDDLVKVDQPCEKIPATELVSKFELRGTEKTQNLIEIIKENTSLVNWQRTYKEEEVGSDFLNRYGYYELIGPEGHYHSNKIRGFIAYWGEELTYDWHSHEAEEIYFILAGSGLFRTKEGEKILKANETCFHKSWQSHSMVTFSEPILTFVLWRGKGMDTLSMMDKK